MASMLIPLLAPLGVQVLTSIVPGVTKELQTVILMLIDKWFGGKKESGTEVSSNKNAVATAIFDGLAKLAVGKGQADKSQLLPTDQISKNVTQAVTEIQPSLKGHETIVPIALPSNHSTTTSDPIAKFKIMRSMLDYLMSQ